LFNFRYLKLIQNDILLFIKPSLKKAYLDNFFNEILHSFENKVFFG